MPAYDSCELRIDGDCRRLIFGMLLIAVLLGALFVGGCARGHRQPALPGPTKTQAVPPKDTKQSEPKSALTAEFGKASILWNDAQGRRVWEAQFKEAIASQTGKDSALELKGVKATLYRNGKAASTLVAPRVIADSRTREVRASGGVKVTSAADGATAGCEQLVWRADGDKITGTGKVRMLKGNITISARSFEADTSLRKARFTEAELGMN